LEPLKAQEAAGTTTLFRAVDAAEMGDLQSTGRWNPSPNGAEGKAFFYSEASAMEFGAQQAAMGGPAITVVMSAAPTDVVNGSYQQSAATEGRAVFIDNQNLPRVEPQVPTRP
jgi:hypothetical protein